jgi:hypothetical protein
VRSRRRWGASLYGRRGGYRHRIDRCDAPADERYRQQDDNDEDCPLQRT